MKSKNKFLIAAVKGGFVLKELLQEFCVRVKPIGSGAEFHSFRGGLKLGIRY